MVACNTVHQTLQLVVASTASTGQCVPHPASAGSSSGPSRRANELLSCRSSCNEYEDIVPPIVSRKQRNVEDVVINARTLADARPRLSLTVGVHLQVLSQRLGFGAVAGRRHGSRPGCSKVGFVYRRPCRAIYSHS